MFNRVKHLRGEDTRISLKAFRPVIYWETLIHN
jgi:hypothetical protein